MPTKREREYYSMGFKDGYKTAEVGRHTITGERLIKEVPAGTYKRKLSAWNKFVKANSKKPRFRLRSGSPNLKKLAVAFRKTPAGKKKRR